SDSVDLVLLNHAMERIAGRSQAMKEIHRVARHGAQVCILATYTAGDAPPGTRFDEHTPRLWTTSPDTLVYAREYVRADSFSWGLAQCPDIDLRCIRMELFYRLGHRHLKSAEKRERRRTNPSVCDLILCHLVVIKRPTTKKDLEAMVSSMSLF